jgi:hypothetical protein
MPTGPISRLRTLWLGETARAEFAAAAEVLVRDTDSVIRSVADAERPPAATETPAADRPPAPDVFDLIVAAESFPDELPPGSVHRLRRRHPAARWVRLVGPWCDGEVRSASPPPATLRVPWHRAAVWLARQFERMRAGERSEIDDPPTFDEADRLPAARLPQPTRVRQATFGVWAEEPAAREWLLDAVSRLPSVRPIVREAARGVDRDIAVCDLSTADGLPEQVADVRQAYPRASLVVLVGFARPGDVAALYQAGAAMVLPKPVLLADLEAAIQAVVDRIPL